MNNKSIYLIILIILTLTGCATAPNVKLGYYLPKASMKLEAVQTIRCKAKGITFTPILKTTFETTVIYSDNKAKKYYLNPKVLGGIFSDSKFSLTYQGGRIAKFTPSVTGNGGQALGAISGLLNLIKSQNLDRLDTIIESDEEIIKACNIIIKEIKGPLKQVVVKYQWNVSNFKEDFKDKTTGKESEVIEDIIIHDNPASIIIKSERISFKDISAIVDVPIITIKDKGKPDLLHEYVSSCKKPSNDNITQSEYVNCLTKEGELVISLPREYITTAQFKDGTQEIVYKNLMIPQSGLVYTLPIPKGVLFGGADANFEFNIDGSLKTVSYNHTSGVEDFGNAASKLQSELGSDSSKVKADKIKSESDLIYQQERERKCQENPSECPK